MLFKNHVVLVPNFASFFDDLYFVNKGNIIFFHKIHHIFLGCLTINRNEIILLCSLTLMQYVHYIGYVSVYLGMYESLLSS